MRDVQRIRESKARAERIGVTFHRLCLDTGLPYPTVTRWLGEAANPLAAKIETAADRLEARVQALERDLARELIALHPDVVQRAAA